MKPARLATSKGARVLWKTTIVLFFLWHAGALLVYTMPQAAGTMPEMVRAHVLPIVEPYLLFTNQWQNWDLFSPDPMRRTSRYHIAARLGSTWTTLRILEPSTARLWRRSDEFSFPLQMEENESIELFERYLRALCAPLGLREGTSVALVVEYTILPESPPRSGWARWRAMMVNGWDWWTVAITPCPAPGDPAIIPLFPL